MNCCSSSNAPVWISIHCRSNCSICSNACRRYSCAARRKPRARGFAGTCAVFSPGIRRIRRDQRRNDDGSFLYRRQSRRLHRTPRYRPERPAWWPFLGLTRLTRTAAITVLAFQRAEILAAIHNGLEFGQRGTHPIHHPIHVLGPERFAVLTGQLKIPTGERAGMTDVVRRETPRED